MINWVLKDVSVVLRAWIFKNFELTSKHHDNEFKGSLQHYFPTGWNIFFSSSTHLLLKTTKLCFSVSKGIEGQALKTLMPGGICKANIVLLKDLNIKKVHTSATHSNRGGENKSKCLKWRYLWMKTLTSGKTWT